jgi:hypothetical protein
MEVTDNRDWRKDCRSERTASAKKETPAPIHTSLVPEQKRRLEARFANLERQNKELKAKLVELETAQKTKTKATRAASRDQEQQYESRTTDKLPKSTCHRSAAEDG